MGADGWRRVFGWSNVMRLFVAIELSEAVRKSLVATQTNLKRKCPNVRWTSTEQLHLTVKFLGEVADKDVPAVCDAVLQAAAKSAPFRMQTGACGCFPARGEVRIVWVQAEESGGHLINAAKEVEAHLEPLGFPPENRPFAAHITIGRAREDRSRGELRKAVEAFGGKIVEQDVSSLVVMSSVPSAQGSTYTVVSRARLGA